MKQTTSPQTSKEENKIDSPPPWPAQFNRQDLLDLCDGSGKGADFLYCILNKARWEIHNQKLDPATKVVKFQFAKNDIYKALAKKNKTLSQGLYSINTRRFTKAGYVISQPYHFLFEVHFDVLEQRIAALAEDSNSSQGQAEKSVKVSKRQTDKVNREEYDLLLCQFVSLTEMYQSLTNKVSFLTEFCQSLTNSNVGAGAQGATSSTTTDLQSNDSIEITKSNDSKREKDDCANASSSCPRLLALELDPDIEDLPEAQPPMSYSQETTQPTSLEQNTQNEEVTAGAGYRTNTDVDSSSQQNKPAKGKRGRGKNNAEQPSLPFEKGILLNEDEQRVYNLYCKLWFIAVPPKINDTLQKHCKTLAPFVHTFDEMESLEKAARAYTKSISKETKVLTLGWFVNDKVLNPWVASRKNETRSNSQEQKQPIEFDPNKPVIWTRYKHTGPAIAHWYLYEVMPLSEAQKYAYKADMIPLNDRTDIKTMLKALAAGHQQLTPEQKQEQETAELRLHLVAVA